MGNYKIYLDNILKNVPGAIYWKDINGVYLGCNHFEAEIAGLNSSEEIISKTDYDLVWKDIADILRAKDKRIMDTGMPEEVIESGMLSNGTNIVLLANKALLRDQNGNIIGVIGTSIDITTRVEPKNGKKRP